MHRSLRTPAVFTHRRLAGALAVVILLLTPEWGIAQGTGDGFLFGAPRGRIVLQGGFSQPRARSDIFDFVTTELTLGRGDFATGLVGASAGVQVTPRLEIAVGADYAGREARSESRNFTGEDDLPILQHTALHRVPLLASARFALLAPGRAVGRYAWIPARVVPVVGVGVGALWYRFQQRGEFVDTQTLDIFEDEFQSEGWTVAARGLIGADFSLSPRFGLTAEGRYLWGRAPMRQDFDTFNKIDLSGYDASIGIFVRF